MNNVAVIGLGYVGLPLALLAEEKGFNVIGVDLDQNKLSSLQNKEITIEDKQAEQRLKKSKINFTDDFSLIIDRDIVIICVPTPVDKDKQPDISLVEKAVTSSVRNMKAGGLLVIESTINPGVCDELVIPLIEKESKYKVGEDIFVAHCPERINPGDPKWSVDNINRVLGADSQEGLDIAYAFYSKIIDANIKKMGGLKEAEAVKIVENTFRDINIAFVNELAMSFNKLGINTKNVIDGAATKPFAFMPHYPGIGIGGHCIPVDPYYLIQYARDSGFDHKFLSLARSINENMPKYAVEKLEETYKEKLGKDLKDAKVVVLGLAYKPNVADDRESPAYKVIDELKKQGAMVTAYDPYLPDKSDSKSLKSALKDQDIAVLVTAHQEFIDSKPDDFSDLKFIFDGRNALNGNDGLKALGIGVHGI